MLRRLPGPRTGRLLLLLAAIGWSGACALEDSGLLDPGGGAAGAATSTSMGEGGAPPQGAGGAPGAVCGNGLVEAGEECDDANMNAGDGCSPECRAEPLDACPGYNFNLSPSGRVLRGDLGKLSDNVTLSCGRAGSNDAIYAFSPTVTGTLSVTLTSEDAFEKAISLRVACPDLGPVGELSCNSSETGEPLSLHAWVEKGSTYYLVVDGEPRGYTLEWKLGECGDKMKDGLEECDDASCPTCVSCSGVNDFWDLAHTRCYHLFEDSRSWAKARQVCVEWGGDLVGLGTEAELIDVTALGLTKVSPDFVWTGGFALSPTCAYIFPYGEALTDAAWELGQPDNMMAPESCVSLHRQFASDYEMIDEPCEALHPYLCMRLPANSCGAECQSGCLADEFTDPLTHHCYAAFTDRNATNFATARQICEGRNSYLASISSEEENALVASHLSKDAWLGAQFSSSLGWQWLTGEPFCFARWQSGEPGVGHDCMELVAADHRWRNESCTAEHEFVCERDP